MAGSPVAILRAVFVDSGNLAPFLASQATWRHPMWATIHNFCASRWKGQVALRRVYWRDMMLVGTSLNAVAFIASLLLAKKSASAILIALTLVAPFPYAALVYIAVWLACAQTNFVRATLVRATATLWFLEASSCFEIDIPGRVPQTPR